MTTKKLEIDGVILEKGSGEMHEEACQARFLEIDAICTRLSLSSLPLQKMSKIASVVLIDTA